jgi:hypothetical protein
MAGTKSILRRRSDGFDYAAASNTSNGSSKEMDTLLKEIVEGVSQWPQQNLF